MKRGSVPPAAARPCPRVSAPSWESPWNEPPAQPPCPGENLCGTGARWVCVGGRGPRRTEAGAPDPPVGVSFVSGRRTLHKTVDLGRDAGDPFSSGNICFLFEILFVFHAATAMGVGRGNGGPLPGEARRMLKPLSLRGFHWALPKSPSCQGNLGSFAANFIKLPANVQGVLFPPSSDSILPPG